MRIIFEHNGDEVIAELKRLIASTAETQVRSYSQRPIKPILNRSGSGGPKMEMLSSSAIRAAGYDAALRQMVIQFTSRRSYTFYKVPREVYAKLLRAPSAGRFYNQYIKGRYSTP